MKSRFWKHFITGLLVIFPSVVTLFILRLLFGWLYGLMIRPTSWAVAWLLPSHQAGLLVQVVVLILLVLTVAFLGFCTHVLLLRRVFGLGEGFVLRIPVIGVIYGTLRAIADAVAGDKKGQFGRVVLVEWPGPGIYSIGFVTSEEKKEASPRTPSDLVNVFIPTAPTPAGGFLIFIEREKLIELDISVEEGFRLIVSCGVTGPDVNLLARKKRPAS